MDRLIKLREFLESDYDWSEIQEEDRENGIIKGKIENKEVLCSFLDPNASVSADIKVDYVAIPYEQSFILYKLEKWPL
ncbi:unnamed protein product [Blepharisma stoltei]|uniref:Uncharacterized protein n=1 Tax=Blepharisma stoltei TaxID=1481888 RepID=A0AAU9ITP1_9CILI|nr:unnamed protein product [Blepharisma stoltei]